MIRTLLQGAWNLGHRRRYQELEARVTRLERWLEIHGPFVDPRAVRVDPQVFKDIRGGHE